MKNSAATIALSILLFVFLSLSCSLPGRSGPVETGGVTATAENNGEAEEPTSIAENPGETDSDGEVMFGEGSQAVDPDSLASFQGGVSFEVAGANSVELLLDANSLQEQRISLQAADGTEWVLSVPPYALYDDVLIKLTELTNIRSDDLGSLQTGVLLEPDGLEFALPVTLIMLNAEAQAHPIIFNGSQDGSPLSFALVEPVDGGVSAKITHFSTAYGDPLMDVEKLAKVQAMAREEYKKVRAAVLPYLKEKIFVPQPPAIPLRCAADESAEIERKKLLDAFLEEFVMPEAALVHMLISASRSDALINGTDNDGLQIATQLMERLVRKGNLLYNTYYPQEEFFLAVSRAGLYAERQYSLLGGNVADGNFIKKTGEWVRKIADGHLNEFRTKHDYQLMETLLSLDREASILGKSRDNSINEIMKSLEFSLQFDVQVDIDVDEGVETILTQGVLPYNGMDFEDDNAYQPGTGQYISFSTPIPDAKMELPASFPYEAIILKFDPCKTATIEVAISRFGADTETYLYGDSEYQVVQTTEGFVMASMYEAYQAEVVEDLSNREGELFFKFVMPMQNLNPIAGEIALPRDIPQILTNLKIKLVHTPR